MLGKLDSSGRGGGTGLSTTQFLLTPTNNDQENAALRTISRPTIASRQIEFRGDPLRNSVLFQSCLSTTVTDHGLPVIQGGRSNRTDPAQGWKRESSASSRKKSAWRRAVRIYDENERSRKLAINAS
ncbi:hypothetical protein VTK26DRAFT_6124 [Humicola hyalothermophila]